jgi:hypothetical protein
MGFGWVYGIWCHFQQYFSYIVEISYICAFSKEIKKKLTIKRFFFKCHREICIPIQNKPKMYMVYIILSIIVMMDITHNKSLYILQVANGYDPPSFSSSLVVLARLLWLYRFFFNFLAKS